MQDSSLASKWSRENITKVEVGQYAQVNFCSNDLEVGRDAVQVNFKEPAGMYKLYGKAEVDKTVKEFEQGKKALTEPALDGDRVLLTVQTIFMKYWLGSAKACVVAFFDNSST